MGADHRHPKGDRRGSCRQATAAGVVGGQRGGGWSRGRGFDDRYQGSVVAGRLGPSREAASGGGPPLRARPVLRRGGGRARLLSGGGPCERAGGRQAAAGEGAPRGTAAMKTRAG